MMRRHPLKVSLSRWLRLSGEDMKSGNVFAYSDEMGLLAGEEPPGRMEETAHPCST